MPLSAAALVSLQAQAASLDAATPPLEIEVGGARLQLLSERAAFLPEHRTLLVADAHIGKAQSFRRLGVPVPGGTTVAMLQRLSQAIARTQAQRVVFLGDLLHSARARAPATWAAVADWRACHEALELTLVRGNHDLHAGDPPAAWRITCVAEPWPLGPLVLAHHPQTLPGSYVLAGHVHPAVVLGGGRHGRLRLPCFHFAPGLGLLPAFGEFTGMHTLPQQPDERIYVVADDEVRAVTRPQHPAHPARPTPSR